MLSVAAAAGKAPPIRKLPYPVLGVEARVDDAVHVEVQVVELDAVGVGLAAVDGARVALRVPRLILHYVFDD